MRVAVIKSNYTPYGGQEKYTGRIIQAFAGRVSRVDVLTAEDVRWGDFGDNVRWVRMNRSRYNNYLRLVTFNASVSRHLEKERYDCVLGMDHTEVQTHLRAGGGCHAAWLAIRSRDASPARKLGFRLNPFHRAATTIERRAFLAGPLKRIFCNSHMTKREIASFYPRAAEKIMVVHNGVEWTELSAKFDEGEAGRKDIRISLGFDSGRFYFLFVGSGYERKGLARAIGALRHLPEHTSLIVIGKDRHPGRYAAMAQRQGIAERVLFLGPRKDVVTFYKAADAFVLPTMYDPFSNASLEALAMGLYTVTSPANGCSEVIVEGAGAIIRGPMGDDSVAEAMRSALAGHLNRGEIRDSVRHLDFDGQLGKIVEVCIADARGGV